MTGTARSLDAVVLAGGRSTRLGGRDKATLLVGGARLVDRAVAAAQGAGVRHVVVVGPGSLEPGVPVAHEDPPFGGPVAGLAAGLAALGSSEQGSTAVLVLACDLADPLAAVGALTAAWGSGTNGAGVHLVDAGGQPQWLTGIYRRAALDAALAAIGDPTGRSARDLLAGLPVLGVEVAASAAADIDTWEDLDIVRRRRDLEEAPMSDHPRGLRPRVPPTSDLSLPPIQSWVEHLCQNLGVDSSAVELRALLDMARDVAHQVDRPAAPVSAFIVGLAAAREGGTPDAVRAACERTAEAARAWEAS